MSGYTSFNTSPDQSEAPDECQFAGCTDAPQRWVRFTNPKEYICFCKDHARRSEELADNATRNGRIT